MRVRTILLAALLLCLSPATAHAWWWDFFDGLSGPGPFRARTSRPFSAFESNIWAPDANRIAILSDDKTLKWFAVARVVVMDNSQEIEGHNGVFENFVDVNGKAVAVRLVTYDVALMRRYFINNRIPLDVGGGLSVMVFSGDTFDTQYRVGPIVKLRLTPLGGITSAAPLAQSLTKVVKLYADFTVFQGLTGRSFGNPNIALPGVEAKVRAGVSFDVLPVLCQLGLGCR